jgi:predicted metal-dependent TIM-barrel fold hydrolase
MDKSKVLSGFSGASTANILFAVALGVYPYAIDPEAAERLWALSERLTGEQTVA